MEVNGNEIDSPFPWTNGRIKVDKYDEHVKISLDSKFTLLWNGKGRAVPTLDASMFGKVCGLLGNADDNPDNDMQMRMPDGTMKTTSDVNKFGNSWVIPGSC
ncbi:mucin-2-like [Saccoglossus kowalevskii]